MNKAQARQIAQKGVTIRELKEILKTARRKVTDWTRRSRVNKTFSVGMCFNILWGGIKNRGEDELGRNAHILIVTNILREFGEYSQYEVEGKSKKSKELPLHHEDPVKI